MDKIGTRLVQSIRERAEQNGTKFREERRKLNFSPQDIYNWEKLRFNPSALVLQDMALAGYDVHWILTGERK